MGTIKNVRNFHYIIHHLKQIRLTSVIHGFVSVELMVNSYMSQY